MEAKLILSVKEIEGIAQIVYFCKERKRIYKNKFAQTINDFKKNYKK